MKRKKAKPGQNQPKNRKQKTENKNFIQHDNTNNHHKRHVPFSRRMARGYAIACVLVCNHVALRVRKKPRGDESRRLDWRESQQERKKQERKKQERKTGEKETGEKEEQQ
jgi:hypothetical protein